jgi:3,4-dihydroxy 2-butanone 4-phosphate synthase/GTP cyclohydrolase II
MRATNPSGVSTQPQPGERSLSFLQPLFQRLAARSAQAVSRPFVTLSYAQSIDGSIAAQPACPVALSSEASFVMTHYLRSRHCALLVGIDTVLADDPRLTVRFCAGENPRPVVLDSRLRIPDRARLMTHPDRKPLLLTTAAAPAPRIERLRALGAAVEVMPCDAQGRVDLPHALAHLAAVGTRALMVEGGATVIDSFLRQRMVDYCVITVAPRLLLGGVKPMGEPCAAASGSMAIADCGYHRLGRDLVIHGVPSAS